MTTLCLLTLIVSVPTGIVGAACMLKLARDMEGEQ